LFNHVILWCQAISVVKCLVNRWY